MSIVITEDRGPVRHVVLNRPEKRNALNGELVEALREALTAAAADPEVKALVLRGAGPMFSSGMDVGALGQLAAEPAALRGFRRPILETWNLLEEMTKPTVAQIHGACIGGAMELVLACDLRVMAADAIIGMPETRVGLVPDVGGSSRLPAVVGLGGRRSSSWPPSSSTARRPSASASSTAWRRPTSSTPPRRGCSASCWPARRSRSAWPSGSWTPRPSPGLAGSLELEVTLQQICVATDDFAEATRAFAEKRQPEFSGR
jgi:enoyl-CoA hydratase/carnithine racemase